MKRIVTLYLKTLLFWLVFWLSVKAVFLVWNFSETANLTLPTIANVFAKGFIMDLSAACYLSVFPAVLLVLYPFSPKISICLSKVYVAITLALMLLLVFADLATFPEWGVRLNTSALVFLKEPKMVLTNLFWWQWILVFLAYLGLCIILFVIYTKLQHSQSVIQNESLRKSIVHSVIALVLGLLLIIPIRGGLGTAPLNPSHVHFNGSYYANQAAYNPFWMFMYSWVHNLSDTSCPVAYMSEKEADFVLKTTDENGDFCISLPNHTNVIIVLLESFSQSLLDEGYCPQLRRISEESLVWDSCFATGNRSDKGTMAVLAGFPALIKYHSVARFENCLHKLPSLPQYAVQNGYNTAFVCGFDADFYNLKLFLQEAGCYDITDRSDFSFQQSTMSKWGVPDEIMYKRVLAKSNELYQKRQYSDSSFLLMTYTVSSHTPFDIPKTFKSMYDEKYFNSIAYADSCLAVFINELKHLPLWNSTLVVLTSDHTSGMQLLGYANDQNEAYRIPMIFTGGVIQQPQLKHNIVSQTDLMATLSQMLGWQISSTCFSKSMFRQDGFATFYRDEFWGYISKDASYLFDLQNNNLHPTYCTDSIALENAILQGKAYTQKIFYTFDSLKNVIYLKQ
ncbi:MAG: sulfatase-like hydrolase/transferase [Paludibacteraceae bacterium]|nr:sulfatase-like hydrolase/transferase [Paludibacteraceae bacterium]